jgi:hypothetical protein
LAILARFVFALAVVFGTYNPEGVSYYHWLRQGGGSLPLKAFVGVVLLIAWVLLAKTARSSLGTLTWLVMSYAHLEAHSGRAITYVVGVALAAVLSVGLGWARTRQKLTGQVDVD